MKRKRRAEHGFTLMEIMVVIALIAALSLLAAPRLHVLLNPDVEKDVARELENLVLAVREESALGRAPMVILFDLERGTFRTGLFTKEGLPETGGDPLGVQKRLPDGVKFLDIATPSNGKITRGTGYAVVWPTGWIEPTTLHIEDPKGNPFTLFIEPVAGLVRLETGYLERRRLS